MLKIREDVDLKELQYKYNLDYDSDSGLPNKLSTRASVQGFKKANIKKCQMEIC